MFKINLKVFIVISIMCFSCSNVENKSEKFSPKIINIISKEDFNYPSVFNPFLFFGRCENNKIAILHVNELKIIHELQFKDLEFGDFLHRFLNQSITVNCSEKFYYFNIDTSVDEVYKKKDFTNFSKQFCDVIDSKTVVLKKGISKDKMNTIFYIFFRNNYLSYFDDKTGRYFLRKTSGIIE